VTSERLQLLLIGLAIILLLSRALGALAESWFRQPRVTGEIVAGIVLGPSLFAGTVSDTLFPAESRMVLSGLASLAVAMFMFVVGMSIEGRPLAGRGRVTGGAVAGATLVPFVLGTGLALVLARSHAPERPALFVVFMALAMSVTALPVLARILADRNLMSTAIGGIALSTAAMVDLLAWTALAGLQAWAIGTQDLWRVSLLVPYGLVMVFGVRPLTHRLLRRERWHGRGLAGPFVVVLAGTLLSAAAAEAIGIHSIFGAFLFGVMMPRQDAVLRAELESRVGHFTAVLLPVYFVVAGLKVDLGQLDLSLVWQLGLILLVALVGKVGGTYLGTRMVGLPPRPASALAVLMNTRGLTELVILGVGLEMGLLPTSLYSLMVVMALVTTAMTGPLLSVIYRHPVVVELRSGPEDGVRAHGSAGNRTERGAVWWRPDTQSTAHPQPPQDRAQERTRR
jgi:Kef-type K+ transport system membrane component KefB